MAKKLARRGDGTYVKLPTDRLIDKVYGKLTVIGCIVNAECNPKVLCRCSCGKEVMKYLNGLLLLK